MSALAQICAMRGDKVSGSDKFLDSKVADLPLWGSLKKLGVKFYPQDASGITKDLDGVILSSAINEQNPDYLKAKQLNLPLIHRSKSLADIISEYKTIAVTGTSGKSTTTAMIFEILQTAGKNPSVITGAPLLSLMKQGLVGNAFLGKSDIMVIEADESDGSFVNYHPEVALMLNLSKDHKDMDTLTGYFKNFRKNCKKFIINADENNLDIFKSDKTFGLKKGNIRATNIKLNGFTSVFRINNTEFKLNVAGIHNVSNAVASVSACVEMGADLPFCAKALENFKGTHRRFNSVGKAGGIEVIDDFAHNPEKIKASIKAAQLCGKRVLAFYQPHGYLPMQVYGQEIIRAFSSVLRDRDFLWMSDIYNVGQVPIEGVSSENICKSLQSQVKNVFCVSEKEDVIGDVTGIARSGDIVLIMGARDPMLNDYSHRMFNRIKEQVRIKSVK